MTAEAYNGLDLHKRESRVEGRSKDLRAGAEGEFDAAARRCAATVSFAQSCPTGHEGVSTLFSTIRAAPHLTLPAQGSETAERLDQHRCPSFDSNDACRLWC